MFLRRKPAQESRLDVMGPRLVYLLAAAALGLALFLALAVLARAVPGRTGGAASRTP